MDRFHGALKMDVGDLPVFGSGVSGMEAQYQADAARSRHIMETAEPVGRAAVPIEMLELVSNPED